MCSQMKNEAQYPHTNDACIFCGICAKKCPMGAITVDRQTKRWQVDQSLCVRCGVCAGACPKQAIQLEIAETRPAVVPLSKGVLVCEEALCAGCRNCMFACSLANEGVASLSLARIQMNIYTQAEFEIAAQPCQQCVDPQCLYACPVGAIQVDAVTGARYVDQDLCIGCQRCVQACPYEISRMRFNPETRKASKCDLCGGDPTCVKMCPTGALRYVTNVEGLHCGYEETNKEE